MRKLLLIATISLTTLAVAAPASGAVYDPSPAEGLYGQIHAKQVNRNVEMLSAISQRRESATTSTSFGEAQPEAMASNAGVNPYQQVINSQYHLNSQLNGLH